jgi:CRISPR-associated protein Csm3
MAAGLNPIWSKNIMKLNAIQKLAGTLELVSGLHIGSGNNEMHIGGTDNPVIKHPLTQQPYIPGSSIKGKMRSLLEWELGVVGQTDGHPLGFKHIADIPGKNQAQAKNLLLTETKMENMIDRIRGVAEHPRNTERVPAGARFEFNLTIRVHEGDKGLLETVWKGLKLLELTGLGGSGSRGYGKVKFDRLTLDGDDVIGKIEQAGFGQAA